MSHITYFASSIEEVDIPGEFPDPFKNTPHPLAKSASVQLQNLLTIQKDWQHDFKTVNGGKMFGVLVVKDQHNKIGFLSAFSGMLAGKWILPGFVPPIFDPEEMKQFLPAGETQIAALTTKITSLIESKENQSLKQSLASLEKQYELENTALKKQHADRKALRNQQREEIEFSIYYDAATRNGLLNKLILESQRDKKALKIFNNNWQTRLNKAKQLLTEFELQLNNLKKQRTALSTRLHSQVFSAYQLKNYLGETETLPHFFDNNNPPGGAGDCAAPKLLNYAYKNKLRPIALAEFWWGAPPNETIRHHAHYYPPCRGKCHPILPFMLKGLNVEKTLAHGESFPDDDAPYVIYEDDDLLVVDKPQGLLSVPGKKVSDSVLTRLQQRYPEASGPLLVHRLDMATSGLLLVAKNLRAHKALQRQFIKRVIEKRYVAILCKEISTEKYGNEGTIDLPLRVDFEDRPRQMVCYDSGRNATTHWELISNQSGNARVYFYPHTGRTHQLRVHASHKDGLNAPILGDKLYGKDAERLFLHAERLRFIHPTTGETIEVVSPVPF